MSWALSRRCVAPSMCCSQVGGRCRLVEPGDVVSLTSEQIQEAMHQKEVKKRQMEMEDRT